MGIIIVLDVVRHGKSVHGLNKVLASWLSSTLKLQKQLYMLYT